MIERVSINRVFGGLSLLIAFGWLYYPVISAMVSQWYHDSNHSHGFLIPLIAGYFAWRRKEHLKQIKIAPTNWGIIVLVGGLMVYILGELGAAYTTMRVSMLIVISGTLLCVLGRGLFKELYFPFFYLFLMIPVPSYVYNLIALPLKALVTKYSVLFMQFIGITVLREGNIIMFGNVVLQVVDACSGIRSLISLIAIGIAFAYVSQTSKLRKIILVFSTIPIAISTNSARIILTGILARYYGSEVSKGFFHEFAGLGVFMLSIILLIVTGVLLKKIR